MIKLTDTEKTALLIAIITTTFMIIVAII